MVVFLVLVCLDGNANCCGGFFRIGMNIRRTLILVGQEMGETSSRTSVAGSLVVIQREKMRTPWTRMKVRNPRLVGRG